MARSIDSIRPEMGKVLRSSEPSAARGGELYALRVTPGRTGELIRALGPALLTGRSVYCLDGGNVFDPYPLAEWLVRRRVNPNPILAEQVFVSRAFTCHQLAGAVGALLEPLAPLAARGNPPLAVILGVERLFLDEDLPMHERRYLFERILADARRLGAMGLPPLITFGDEADGAWGRRIAQTARVLPDLRRAIENFALEDAREE